jgi:hypothetical protein
MVWDNKNKKMIFSKKKAIAMKKRREEMKGGIVDSAIEAGRIMFEIVLSEMIQN